MQLGGRTSARYKQTAFLKHTQAVHKHTHTRYQTTTWPVSCRAPPQQLLTKYTGNEQCGGAVFSVCHSLRPIQVKKTKTQQNKTPACACMCASGRWGGGRGRGCDGMAALCFLCRSLLFFRARKMGLCNSHVISPEIVVGLQLLPLLLQLGSLAFGSSQTDTLRSAPASSENNFCSVLHTDTRMLCTVHATKGDAPARMHASARGRTSSTFTLRRREARSCN